MKYLLSIIFILFLATNIQAKLHTETIEYKEGDTVLEGYLAYDDAIKGKRPGVMVVHEWTGLGPYVKRRAEELAKLGYIAFAADIYGKGVRPKDHEEAAKVSGIYFKDRSLMRARAQAGCRYLRIINLLIKVILLLWVTVLEVQQCLSWHVAVQILQE